MNLYFNGCSFTFGDELKNPAKSAWPTLVADLLKSKFVNDAVGGGTNERILYKTVPNIENYDFFFIAWTSYYRFTEYNPVDNFEINFSPSLELDVSSHLSYDLKRNYLKYKEYGEIFYTHWFNELYAFKQWLQQIVLLQAYFSQHHKQYLMLNSIKNNLTDWLKPKQEFIQTAKKLIPFFDYVDDQYLYREHYSIQELVSKIDQTKFLGWNNWSIDGLPNEFARGSGGHILEDGHQEVAKRVIEFYNINYD